MSVWFWDGVLPEGSLFGSSRQGQEAMRADLSGSQRGVAELGSYKSARILIFGEYDAHSQPFLQQLEYFNCTMVAYLLLNVLL